MQLKQEPKLGNFETVGDLIEALKTLPPSLPVRQGFGEGVHPVVYNAKTDAFLEFAEVEEDEDEDFTQHKSQFGFWNGL